MGRANIDGLDAAARRKLDALLAAAKAEGIPVTVTSAHRTREEQAALYANRANNPYPVAKPGTSRHESGLAVDLHIPKQHRQKFNELAASHQWEWYGPKDAVHYEFIRLPLRAKATGSKPASDPYAAARQYAARAATSDPYAAARQYAHRAVGSKRDSDPYAGARHYAASSGRMTLNQSAAAVNPFAPPTGVMPDIKPQRGPAPKPGLLQWASSVSNAYAGWLNELARQGRRIPNVVDDPAGHFAALPGALQKAFAEGVQSFGPEAVTPEHFRTMLGMEKGKTGRVAYNVAAVADYVSSLATDPTNIVAGPAMKLVGRGLQATTVPTRLGRVAEGARAQAAAQAATRASEAAKTTHGSVKAGGASAATRGKAAAKLAMARADEAAAVQAAEGLAQGSRAAALGVGAAKTKPAQAVIGAEQAAAAHLRQEGTKATQARRKLVGHIKGALLSNLGTASSNVAGSAVMAEHALREAGVPIARFVAATKASKQALDAHRKTQHATGDLAELLQHAPGVIDTPAIIGGKPGATTRNPFLNVQQRADELAKLNLFSALKPTLGAEEAAKRVKALLFDYSDVPAIVKLLDREGLVMFGSFGYSATRAMMDAVLRRPDLVARYPRLQQQLLQEFPGSQEAYEKLKSYERGAMSLPTGKDTFVNVTRYHPLGQMYELTKGEEESGPPTPTDLLSRTALGPLARAAQKTERMEGAPMGERWRMFLREAVASHLPQYGDYLRWRAALQGATRSDSQTAEPQTIGQVALQSAGVTSMRGEDVPDAKERLGGKIDARGRTADNLVAKLEAGLRQGSVKNRFEEEAGNVRSFDDARLAFGDANRYLRSMLLSPRNIDEKGKLLPGGFGRIRDAVLRFKALEARLNALDPSQR